MAAMIVRLVYLGLAVVLDWISRGVGFLALLFHLGALWLLILAMEIKR